MQQWTERVVVTGGAGFIGSHLVDRLLATSGAEVVVFDNLVRGRLANLAQQHGKPRFHFVKGDVRECAAVEDVLAGATTVYHLAAVSDDSAALDDTFSVNVLGTFNVLKAAARGAVQRVLFASSFQVYGKPITLPVDEDHPLVALDCFGASMAAAEVYCRVFRRVFGLPVIILRLATVYGSRDYGRLIPVWLEQATAGKDLQVSGGRQIADLVWVEQAVDALVRGAAAGRPLPPINVASGTGTRLVDVARRIVRLSERRGQHVHVLSDDKADGAQFVADVSRMRHMLKIDPPLDPLAYLPRLLAHRSPATTAARR